MKNKIKKKHVENILIIPFTELQEKKTKNKNKWEWVRVSKKKKQKREKEKKRKKERKRSEWKTSPDLAIWLVHK